MAWLRVDDRFTEHRKVVALKRGDRWTWLELLAYCARHGSGHVPAGIVDVLRYVTPAFVRQCVQVGLLDANEDGSYEVHDWAVYNPKDPLKAARQARWRQGKGSDVDADVDAPVDADVDASAVEERLHDRLPRRSSRAAARARPVPSPTPGTSPPSSTSRANPDDDDLDQALHGIRLTGGARNLATVLLTDDPARLAACVTAALEPSISNQAAYLAQLLLNGSRPEPPRPEQRAPDPTAQCPECGETLGHGHLDTCPRLPATTDPDDDPEPAAARTIAKPPPELLATVGIHPNDPEPAAQRTQDDA